MRRTILFTVPLPGAHLDDLRRKVKPYEVRYKVSQSGKDVEEALDESVEVLFTNHPPGRIEHAPRLCWVQLPSAGINHAIGSPIYSRADLLLTNARGLYDVAVAEFTLALMLNLARNLSAAFDLQRRREWCPNNDRLKMFVSRQLRGRTVGLVGYGGIGQEIARLCGAFGMKSSALVGRKKGRPDRYRLPELRKLPRPRLERQFDRVDELGALLKDSDFVVVSLPLTAATEGLIDEAALSCMKQTAYLINVGRGPLVDEEALVRALKERRIAGAALDVFAVEPVPPESPFYSLDNVIVTPHIAGAFDGMWEGAAELFLENFERYRAGKKLFNLVDRQRGY